MCLPKPDMPDFSEQMEAQQKALKEKQATEAQAQLDAEMKKTALAAKKAQKKRQGRASLIRRTGGSGSLGILDYTPTAAGLRPLGEGTPNLS